MSDKHLVGEEFFAAPVSPTGPETLPPQQFLLDDEQDDDEEELVNTLSPGRKRMRFPQGKLTPKPESSEADGELLAFRKMLVNAKSQQARSTLQLDAMAPSKPAMPLPDVNRRPGSPVITNSRLSSMNHETIAWEKRQAHLRHLKDLNLLLLGVAFGSVLLLAAVVLYMYIYV